MQFILITIKVISKEIYIIKGTVEQKNCKKKNEPAAIKPYLLTKHTRVKKNAKVKRNKKIDKMISESLSLLILFFSESSFPLLLLLSFESL